MVGKKAVCALAVAASLAFSGLCGCGSPQEEPSSQSSGDATSFMGIEPGKDSTISLEFDEDTIYGTFSSADCEKADGGVFIIDIPNAWRDGKVCWDVSPAPDGSGYPRIEFYPAELGKGFKLGTASFHDADYPNNAGDIGNGRLVRKDAANGCVEYWRTNWLWLAWQQMKQDPANRRYSAEELAVVVPLASLGLYSLVDCSDEALWEELYENEMAYFSDAVQFK